MYDYHVHSSFSDDSTITMEEACERAILLGFAEIAFTDHLDIDYPGFDNSMQIDFDAYIRKVEEIRQAYGTSLTVRSGTEVGIQPHVINASVHIVQQYPFDFVIGSVHVVDKLELHSGDFSRGKTKYQAYRRYFEEILNSLDIFQQFDVLGHIDMIRRYGEYPDPLPELPEHMDILEAIFRKLIGSGKGIEINTSGFRYNLNSCMPDLHVLKTYKQLGGEIVTLGSDAHTLPYIGYRFDYAYEILKTAGFRYLTVFENRKARFVPIP